MTRLAVLVLAIAASSAGARADELVRVDGTRFTVGGEPFHFVGANVSIMHGPRERASVEAVLDAAARDGLSVVRVWALGEAPADAEPWRRDYAFRFGPDGWLEESFVHLDRVLAAAQERNLRVIVVLANRWSDYGGAARYLSWAGQPPAERDVPALQLGDLYRCASCRSRYLAHLVRVIGRRNSITGVPYVDDPTIFGWELINEASAHTDADADALVEWVRAMARQIRQMDDDHLISAGHIGYGHSREREVWRRVVAIEEIDYADAHAYPLRDPRVTSAVRLSHWVDDRVQLAHHVVGKPIVFGEVGFARDVRNGGLGRPAWFDRFLGATFRNGAAGALVWIYGDYQGRPRDHGIDAAGDRGVRAVLSRHARRVRRRAPVERNPRLGPGAGDLFPYRQVERGRAAPHRSVRTTEAGWALEIPPLEIHRAEFERVGVYDGAPAHAYGVGTGHVEYRWRAPAAARRAARLTVSLRLSSELPGSSTTVPDASEVTVLIDDVVVGRFLAPPDDGRGTVQRVDVRDPEKVTAILGRGGIHTLTVRADTPPGLCVYATNADQPAPIRIDIVR